MKWRGLAIVGAVLGLTAVAAGAFGAHGLRGRLDPEAMGWFETGARYQLIHALALFGAAWLSDRTGRCAATWAGYSFAIGVVLFSGTLYAMALGGPRWLGAVTPLGGVALMVGWGALALAAWRHGPEERDAG